MTVLSFPASTLSTTNQMTITLMNLRETGGTASKKRLLTMNLLLVYSEKATFLFF